MRGKEDIAKEIKIRFQQLSSLIETFTSEVCPECREVCCKQRHALYDEDDLLFYKYLREEVPLPDSGINPDAPCEFLSPQGCIKPRWQRPFRCTWYFCEALLEYMPERSVKKYRKMIELLKDILLLRDELKK
jgi:hypothetical protein